MESSKTLSGSTPDDIESDLQRLEAGIRQLKVQYDMFFSGALPREPLELRASVERLIKRYSNAPIRKYATRFHFQALMGRFTTLTELWTKTLRSLEEGPRPAPGVSERASTDEHLVATCQVRDPLREEESLRLLHAKFLEVRQRTGGAARGLTFEGFVKGIVSNVERLREKARCDRVELRLVVRDRKVQIKARPGR